MIAISSCLLGKKCRFDGKDSLNQELVQWLADEGLEAGVDFFDLCPEVLGGLSTPRIPCEIVDANGSPATGADVLAGTAYIISRDGKDRSSQFIAGAQAALKLCQQRGVTSAYLKAKSPSCGYGQIYDGSFSRVLHVGNGVFAELLAQNNIEIKSI